jgi:hypothetical protein
MEYDPKAHERLDQLEGKVAGLIQEHQELKHALHENTLLTKQIADNTGEMVEIFKNTKGFVNTIMFIKKVTMPIVIVVGAVYAYVKGHV